MYRFPTNRDARRNDSLFKRPSVNLIGKKGWSRLQRRYEMTARELQVARLVWQGLNNYEIAKLLEIRDGTVKTHLRNIYRRVRVKRKILLLLRFIEDATKLNGRSKRASSVSADMDTKRPTRRASSSSKKAWKK